MVSTELRHRRGRAEEYAQVPSSPPKKRLVPADSAGAGKAQMKHLVNRLISSHDSAYPNSIGGTG